jgi:hypothetical protein
LSELKFYSHWVTESLGTGLSYNLGDDTDEMLAWPIVLGRRTYGVALAQALCVALGAWVMLRAGRRWLSVWPRMPWFGSGECRTDLLLHAVFWGFGLLLTATCLRFYRHYLMAAFPFTMLWLARLALPYRGSMSERRHGRRVLLAVCVANAILTASTLLWLHRHGGTAVGDYGRSYAHQRESNGSVRQ